MQGSSCAMSCVAGGQGSGHSSQHQPQCGAGDPSSWRHSGGVECTVAWHASERCCEGGEAKTRTATWIYNPSLL